MADPFEVRMRFTAQLQHLNASTSSAMKAANYALKYSEFSDDLHSCILEQLERNNMNNRANIMYFLPSLCDIARAQKETAYIRMMERDILQIIDLVAPDDGSGAANVKVVRKVLQQLQDRGFLKDAAIKDLEECITARESNIHAAASSPIDAGIEIREGKSSSKRGAAHGAAKEATGMIGYNPAVKLDKRQIEQRIEEDRERHKRAREGIWAIPQVQGSSLAEDAEFDKLWENGSEADEDDYRLAKEESEERRKYLDFDEI